MELDPSSTAAACDCACSATWFMEAASSSIAALVSSRVDAWLWAPSASRAALDLIWSLEPATSCEFARMDSTMMRSRALIVFRLAESQPTSSLRDGEVTVEMSFCYFG